MTTECLSPTSTYHITSNTETTISLTKDDLLDLFCAIGQGSGYWAEDVTIGNIELDKHGYYKERGSDPKKWEWECEGCAGWALDFKPSDPITLTETETDEDLKCEIWDLIKAIKKILNKEISLCDDIDGSFREAFISNKYPENDMSCIDAEAADCILQVAFFGDVVYG